MLTDAKIKAAVKAVTSEVTLNDKAEGRGAGSLLLVARRLADGAVSATWFAKVKRGGKRTKRSLGRYPDVSLSMARQLMRADVSPQLRAGKSLRAAVAGERPTVERMFQCYADSLAGRPSAPEVERMLLTCAGSAADALGRDTHPADVAPADVAEYVRKFFRKGRRGAADKARSYVSAAFGWAIKATNDPSVENPVDWGVDRNPAEAVKKDTRATKTIDRALSADELRALWAATAHDAGGFSAEVAACIRLVVCCGQRVQETLRIEGAEIDLDGALWNMPAHKTKLGLRPHTIPLPHQAVAELRRLVALHGDGPLFPARAGSKGELIDHRSVRQAIDRWLSLPGTSLAKFTPRDLRRTWKSRTHDAGITRDTRDLIQQHAKGDTGSKHYDRADYLPQMREAMVKWASWLDEHVINEPAGSVDVNEREAA